MKYLFAFGLSLAALPLVALPAAAQLRGQAGALGGNFASRGMSRPLGGIGLPAGPGLGPSLRPNLSTGRRGQRGEFRNGSVAVLPYIYPFYGPDYFDSFAGGYPSAPLLPPQEQLPVQQPPVIINQYFAAPPSLPPAQTGSQYGAQYGESDQRPGDPLGPADNYYLIAYKNHSVYTALAYWVEDKTFHYVTTENRHNQASLDLIDMDLTKTLNRTRDVSFSIPGR